MWSSRLFCAFRTVAFEAAMQPASAASMSFVDGSIAAAPDRYVFEVYDEQNQL